MTLPQRQIIGIISALGLVTILALMLLSTSVKTSVPVQNSSNSIGQDRNSQSSQGRVLQNQIPDLANFLLSMQWGADPETTGMEILGATGHQDYIGSNDFPGVIDITDAPHGAHTITFTVEAVPGGTIWEKGNLKFVFWLSHDQTVMRPVNNNAFVIGGS